MFTGFVAIFIFPTVKDGILQQNKGNSNTLRGFPLNSMRIIR